MAHTSIQGFGLIKPSDRPGTLRSGVKGGRRRLLTAGATLSAHDILGGHIAVSGLVANGNFTLPSVTGATGLVAVGGLAAGDTVTFQLRNNSVAAAGTATLVQDAGATITMQGAVIVPAGGCTLRCEIMLDTATTAVCMTTLVAASGEVTVATGETLRVGNTGGLTTVHDGTNTTMTSATGDLIVDNTNATGSTIVRLGTDTAATDFQVQGDGGTARLTVTGAGTVSVHGRLVSSGILTIQHSVDGPTHDALDVSGVNVVRLLPDTGDMTINGFTGGTGYQHLVVIKTAGANNVILANNAATGTEKVLCPDNVDLTLSVYGGYELTFDGTNWFVTDLSMRIIAPPVSMTDTTASTSITTGALVVAGGVGVGGTVTTTTLTDGTATLTAGDLSGAGTVSATMITPLDIWRSSSLGSMAIRNAYNGGGGAVNLTAAQVIGGYTYIGAAGAAVNFTYPGAAAVQTELAAKGITSLAGLRIEPSVLIVNTDPGANAITVTAGAGETVYGTAAIPAGGASATVHYVFTDAAAAAIVVTQD